MGMFDTIVNTPVTCPRCGDSGLKSVQIKPGPQNLDEYEFGKDKIDIDWSYEYYGSIVDIEKRIIRGIATCDKCRKESLDELYKGNKNIELNKELFDVAIIIDKNGVPISADVIINMNER